MNGVIVLAFVLLLVLMLLAYYTGVKSDASAITSSVNTLAQTFTGRTSSGAFANYPK